MINVDRLIVLDRDGVINEESEAYIKTPAEWQPLAGSLEAIAELKKAGFRIVVVSNQSGIGRGLFTLASLEAINRKMTAAVTAAGGKLTRIYCCPHMPIDHCDCRKPRPGLLLQVAEDFGISLNNLPVVGDKASDLEMARRVGARPLLVLTGYGQKTAASLVDESTETFSDLKSAAASLIAESVI
ncbi:MAG: D-glycero-beta-D-manno-heptose 1,7-bisphosphate 7-phosphatase [Candidatus Rariloculaceae bacterium]|tara:strand:+ start:168 stop:722 length:555 start_codon:yes stop_codon:yes gene_type:complete